MEEKQVLQTAIQHFNKITGLSIRELDASVNRLPQNAQVDTWVEIQTQGKTYTFWVELKNELRQVHLGQLIHKLSKYRDNWLLICQYISKTNRALLKEANINYLDASGNCNIRRGGLFLFINDQKASPQRLSNTGKLWKPAGLRLIFSLLLNPELINEPYRSIAQQSKLSLGAIGALLQELENEKYFSRHKNIYRLENRILLLNRWTENYYTILRPKLVQGRFRFASSADRKWWKAAPIRPAFWGGEAAGALLTGYLHPEKFTLYSDLSKTEIIRQLRLVPDSSGELELLKIFWNINSTNLPISNCVPPLLAYAELNSSMDSRNRETAERIKTLYNV